LAPSTVAWSPRIALLWIWNCWTAGVLSLSTFIYLLLNRFLSIVRLFFYMEIPFMLFQGNPLLFCFLKKRKSDVTPILYRNIIL
jgi:hypothetical protein